MAKGALAQDTNYTSVEAVPAKPVELSYHASANKDTCSPTRAPTIHVVEPPKSGMLTVRKGVLKTDRVAGCPNLNLPVQVVLYVARAGYEGADHVQYEVTNENGEVATYNVTITVKAAPPGQTPSPGPAGGQKL